MENKLKKNHFASTYNNSRGCVMTIGTFDGVHIGHKTILKRVVDAARQQNINAVLLTFFPHPRMVLKKDNTIKMINTLAEKQKLVSNIGIDHMLVYSFTKEFSQLSAEEYVKDILVTQLNAKKLIVGYDHRFGHNRTANIETLHKFSATYNFEVEEINAQLLDDVAVSSTKIRNALAQGNITVANTYLGYKYILQGTVVRGKGIGKTLGFPTANLHLDEDYKFVPKKGVYLTQATIDSKVVYGLTNIGNNPTVAGIETTIETYFMNFSKNLYQQKLSIQFITRIRDQKKFDSLASLKQAIHKDKLFAKDFLKQYG